GRHPPDQVLRVLPSLSDPPGRGPCRQGRRDHEERDPRAEASQEAEDEARERTDGRPEVGLLPPPPREPDGTNQKRSTSPSSTQPELRRIQDHLRVESSLHPLHHIQAAPMLGL